MHRFEILPHTADVRVRALGSTRAGLLVAALKGMFSVAGPKAVEGSDEIRRSFTLEATDSNALLILLLSTALTQSRAQNETYHDVTFTLITDKKAEGEFVGRPVASFEKLVTGVIGRGIDMKKNNDGNWEVTVTLE